MDDIVRIIQNSVQNTLFEVKNDICHEVKERILNIFGSSAKLEGMNTLKKLEDVEKEDITYRSIISDENETNKINRKSVETKHSSELMGSREVGKTKPK